MASSATPIRQYMTPSVHTISLESTLPEARDLMERDALRVLLELLG